MTPDQVSLVKTSWTKVLPIRTTAAELFYTKLFSLDPNLKDLFKGDMKEQGQKLMAMISTAVNGLDRLDSIVPAVQALGKRHAGYGVQEENYDTVGNALVWTLQQGLGDAFTHDVKSAWLEAYTVLSTTMKQAATQPAA